MAASDNHSEEPKTTNKNSITTDNPRQGPTRLSLTLLIVVVIVVTSVCSVYRNELFSSIRKMSAKVFSTHSSSQLTGNVSVNKSTESGPGISLVAPSAPTAEINSEKADKLAMSAGSSPKAPSTEFQPLASFKDQEQSKAASNESETAPIAKTNVPGETAPLRQSTPPLDS
ncbi:MAG: hypothetical protein ACP5VS_16055, partial [Desulfomonilaceae bacterium]